MKQLQETANFAATTQQGKPAVYCSTWAKYNNASLAGAWVYLDDFDGIEELYNRFAELHADEADPEYLFNDNEFIPSSLIGESWINDEIYSYLNLDEYEKQKIDVIIDAYGSHYYDDITELIDKLDEFQLVQQGSEAQDYMCDVYPELEKINAGNMYWVALDWERTERDFFTDWSQGSDNEGTSYYVLGS